MKSIPLSLYSGKQKELNDSDSLSYNSTWGETELWNYDWTSCSSASYTHSQSGIEHGPFLFTCYNPGSGGSVQIINGTGLVIASPTTLESAFVCPGGSNGLSGFFNDNNRWDFGGWAIMIHYTYNLVGNAFSYLALDGGYPNHGMSIRRNRYLQNAPNTTNGGIVTSYWYNTERYTYGGTSSDDILCMHIINPWTYNSYSATYSSGWPKLKNMSQRAAITMFQNSTEVNRTNYRPFNQILFSMGIGGSGSSITILKTRIIKVTS